MLQEIYGNPMYIIPVAAIAAILVVIYYVRINKKEKNRRPDTEPVPAGDEMAEAAEDKREVEEVLITSEAGEVNALLHDVKTRSFGPRWVKLLPGKSYGRQWLYGNDLMFWLCRDIKGVISPIIPTEDLIHSPGELYEALQTRDDITEVLGPHSGDLNKIKLALLVIAACVAMFLMFLAAKG